jgi:hypothetical protein
MESVGESMGYAGYAVRFGRNPGDGGCSTWSKAFRIGQKGVGRKPDRGTSRECTVDAELWQMGIWKCHFLDICQVSNVALDEQTSRCTRQNHLGSVMCWRHVAASRSHRIRYPRAGIQCAVSARTRSLGHLGGCASFPQLCNTLLIIREAPNKVAATNTIARECRIGAAKSPAGDQSQVALFWMWLQF